MNKNFLNAQNKIKEIAFHLYTDSLKKGFYNYVNVDGLLDNGHWLPMDTAQICFASSAGIWSGNNLIVAKNFIKDSIGIRAYLKDQPLLLIDTILYIKKNKDPDTLPTMQDILRGNNRSKRRN